MNVTLDYKAGERVIVFSHGKFTVETITGAATIIVNADGSVNAAIYEIDRQDPIYSTLKDKVESKYIFRTKEEALSSVGLANLDI